MTKDELRVFAAQQMTQHRPTLEEQLRLQAAMRPLTQEELAERQMQATRRGDFDNLWPPEKR